jgi:hypothetical protein
MQGITIDDLIDFTPELRQRALAVVKEYELGPLFNPPLHNRNTAGKRASFTVPARTAARTSRAARWSIRRRESFTPRRRKRAARPCS